MRLRTSDFRLSDVKPFVVASTLVVLLGVLGTLQYRWLGEVSNAERDRLRAGLRSRATDFAVDFDREITRTYIAFHVESDALDRDVAGALSEAYAKAQSSSSVGGIVKAVYFLESRGARANQLQALDPAARTLTTVEWPAALASWRVRAEKTAPLSPDLLSPVFLADAIDADAPALVVPVPMVKRIENGGRIAVVPDPTGVARTILVWLDAERVRGTLVESLFAKHFGSAAASEYFVRVLSRDTPGDVVFSSVKDADVTAQNADVTAGLFDLRLEDLSRFARIPPPRAATANQPPATSSEEPAASSQQPAASNQQPAASSQQPVVKDHLAITIVRRAGSGEAARLLLAGGTSQGAWQMLVRAKSGSLEAVVVRSRNRNLAIGLGVLGLLALSFLFVIGSAQRQQRLARQQMEFVAAVSHELRTPLAVIRSAGENLADGVVADAEQTKRYGALIGAEGRRLSDMVERVLQFAGIRSGVPIRLRSDVDVVRVVSDAIGATDADARERGVTVSLQTTGVLPPLDGDPDTLRSAVQNIVGNAIKYSPSGERVEVRVDADGRRLRIVVVDRGLGVDSADLPHVFKPFYRGRRAIDAQIRGSGIGLSVVRHVVEAHRGQVSIESRPGAGTTVTVTLPAATHTEMADDASGASAARAAT